jgi:tRNA pseudouridine38-40 synthase
MRYFAQLAYNGTRFKGWQTQPNGISVQETIQNALQTILRTPTEVIGCGRTDTGVHAAHYMLHFDYEGNAHRTPPQRTHKEQNNEPTTNPQRTHNELPNNFLTRLNHLVGDDIVFTAIFEMEPEAHARFDATSRSYFYKINTQKSPFEQETAYFYPNSKYTDTDKMQACAQMLMEFDEFLPFCKSNAQNKTNKCRITRCEWIFEDTQWTFHITANRFLRGMIRLIVGACLQVGNGKMTLAQIRTALDTQTLLPQPLSAPAKGLFLHDIQYPSTIFVKK